MSTQFQVDPQRISAASSEIARISGEIDAQVTAMMGRLQGLQDAWTGGAASQFQALLAQWHTTQRQVRSALDSISTVLGAAGAQYAETEAQTLRMFS